MYSSMAMYISEQKSVLKQLRVWHKLSADEKKKFAECKTYIQVDNLMVTFRRKYM